MNRIFIFIILLSSQRLLAQSDSSGASKETKGQIHGNVQMLWQQYNADSTIGAQVPEAKSAMNAFGNFTYTYGNLTAGVRFEHYLNSILGFPTRFKGSGIGSRYVRYKQDNLDITVGNFYEQFGSGMTLRTYWEPNLGIDNALDGARIIFNPYQGVALKAIYGVQRFDFDGRLINGDGIVRGLDGEIFINDLIKPLSDKSLKVTLGGSFVSRYQAGSTIEKDSLILQLPNNVSVSGARIGLMYKGFQFNGEYVTKINDPNADNGYIYKRGMGMLANATYSTKGLGITLNAKFIDNMAFRSSRDALLFDVPINFLPSITRQHTYNLAATLYPYATVLNGENGISGEVFYTFKKGTPIGGKYGTYISLNYAAVNSLDTVRLQGTDALINGYDRRSYLFGSSKFVRDFNAEVKKKVSKDWSFAASYYYFEFNTLVTPVTQDFKGIVYANIGVVEAQYKIKPKHAIRVEVQTLQTDQDKGDWHTFLAEYTFSPHWSIAFLDQYNAGNPDPEKRVHYLYGSLGYNKGGSRISVGYGKRRQGIFCIGGVCRAVPASNGLEINITSSF